MDRTVRGDTSWEPVLLAVEQGSVTFLFDVAPTLNSVNGDGRASDRSWTSGVDRPRRLPGATAVASAASWPARPGNRGATVTAKFWSLMPQAAVWI